MRDRVSTDRAVRHRRPAKKEAPPPSRPPGAIPHRQSHRPYAASPRRPRSTGLVGSDPSWSFPDWRSCARAPVGTWGRHLPAAAGAGPSRSRNRPRSLVSRRTEQGLIACLVGSIEHRCGILVRLILLDLIHGSSVGWAPVTLCLFRRLGNFAALDATHRFPIAVTALHEPHRRQFRNINPCFLE
jgi:hypothetical protein